MESQLKPIKLYPARVWRTYHGGKLIDSLNESKEGADNEFPEEWIASVTEARNPGREHIANEGLSFVITEDEERVTLKDMIDKAPELYLGKKHYEKYGNSTAVLAKIIDSSERLTIQAHPSKEKALELFNSSYGKTEAWYIIGGREIDGEQPYVLFGFKPGITKEKWKEIFEKQDIDEMMRALHKIYVKPGQVFLIEGGVPHAIGSGCFLLEIQEPTDYTIRVERVTPAGLRIRDELCHQGAGFEKMFDCFNYDTYEQKEILEKWCINPAVAEESDNGRVLELISSEHTPYFSMRSMEVNRSMKLETQESFQIIKVLKGEGLLQGAYGQVEIKCGDQLFIPANSRELTCQNSNEESLHMIICLPPR